MTIPTPHGIGYPNPLSEREIVLSALVGEGQSDLLGAVGQEVDRLRESLNGWIGAGLEVNRAAGGLLAVLDALKDEFSTGRQVHGSSTASAIGVTEGSDAAGSMSPDSAASCHCGATSLALIKLAVFADRDGAMAHMPAECFGIAELSYERKWSQS